MIFPTLLKTLRTDFDEYFEELHMTQGPSD